MTTLGCKCGKCGKPKLYRGLSNACYGRLRERVNAGELTWEQAEEQGLCDLQKRTPHRKSDSQTVKEVVR